MQIVTVLDRSRTWLRQFFVTLDKLNHYGFRGITDKWFSFCFIALADTNNTSWSIYLWKNRSDLWCSTTCSVLDPLLFLLCNISMITPVPKKFQFLPFADVTIVSRGRLLTMMTLISYMRTKKLKSSEHRVNAELRKLYNGRSHNRGRRP